ncbi:MAG: hypothetical protein RI968_358 [Pseudomonadota bacterium]|jgi:hypothetical protein
MKLVRILFVVFLGTTCLAACGEKDEEKASQNRPAIPGY